MEDDFISCPICMEEYEDPRALPCLHTFCYKCLVHLAVKKVLENSSLQGSRITRYMTDKSSGGSSGQLKLSEQDANHLDSLLRELDRRNVLKCPLCTEEHPIPSDKGVAGFRKDFRVNKLVDQYHCAQGAELHVKKCPCHVNKDILFYCENETCKSDICENCWADNHDKHNVILLSKKVDSAKDILKQQVAINMNQNLSRMNALLKAYEDATNGFILVENEVNRRFHNIQEKVKKTLEMCLEELNRQKKEQQTDISQKMDALCRQQDEFKRAQEKLDSEVKCPTIISFHDYEHLVSEMKKLNTDLDEWIFMYKIPKLSDDAIEFVFVEGPEISYEAVCLDKQQIENIEKHNYKVEQHKDCISVRHQSENGREIQSKNIRETETKSSSNAVSSPKNLDTKAAEVKKVDPESHGYGKGEFILKLETSIAANAYIESFAVSPDEKIYIATKSHFLCYRRGLTAKVLEIPRIAAANASAVVISRLHQAPFLVQLDIGKKVLHIISLTTNSLMYSRYVRKQDPMPFLTSSEHYLAYAFNQGGRVYIQVLSIEDKSATIMSQPSWVVHIPLPLRSISLSITGRSGCPVVVCAYKLMILETSKHQPALVSTVLGETSVSSETITFGELDPSAYAFDLKCVCSIGGLIFALNVEENVVYRVMKSGKRHERVTNLEFVDAMAHTEFSAARYMYLFVGPLGRDIFIHALSHDRKLSSFKLNTGSVL